ncbi:MAG TPA: aminoglycoside phosphotransferase [Lachnoclostridium sp.]|uniref:phosphotransferase family protein n=1 Tax=Lacrimispora sp. TaxID=2719234 RepID=UPI000EDAD379|nr:aminoglycoside phosphotransferase family protein [Lacrimispora sp.]HCD43584.1 aminoglycoside phosphotransferase [Lachnoclostridium sp.]
MAAQLIATTATKKVFRDGDKAIKVFNADFPKADVLNEALITARVEEVGGINVPKVLEVGVFEGKWSITFDFIEGKTLQQLMDENPDKLPEYMEGMVDLHLSILSKQCPLLNKLKDKMSRQILDTEELGDVTRYDMRTQLDSMPKHTKLCHGDFNPSNIVVKDDGTMYVLDWVHATQGNASADVARTYLLFCLQDQNKADMYMNLFCKKTGTAKKYVQTWLPIVAAAQLSKKRPEEAELLNQWANVCDYQ